MTAAAAAGPANYPGYKITDERGGNDHGSRCDHRDGNSVDELPFGQALWRTGTEQ